MGLGLGLLSMGKFRDALRLRFGWQPVNLPQMCVRGQFFSMEHAFVCPYGGFPSIRHNEIRDLTASLLSEVCGDVGVEPALQPVEGEPLQFATANGEDGARLDAVARDFGVRIDSMRFLMSGCSTLLQAPIFVPNCPDITSHMNMRSDGHMIHVLERLRELAFHHWCLQLQVAWGPLLQLFLGSLLLCWLRSAALIIANAYSGCAADCVFHC